MFYLYADEGVLGSLTGISANLLMVFILFASFMLHSGVGQFFMDISIALAGRFRGGPAKVAVVSSALYGTVSGSSVADCYATGTFTIPLMKKIGYRADIAAAIEATASCGGPLMPPIMGAGAFIMAELTGVPYSTIIVAAALPAILYYVGIMATVHWEALKHGLGTMAAEIPPVRHLLRRALLFVPFGMVLFCLEAGYSPSKAALYSLFTAVVVSWFAGEQPMTPRRMATTMVEAMRSGAIIACVLAASGLIVAAMSRTGFALAFSSAIINFSAGSLIVALFLIFAVVSILGTGIPTTPAYILAVTVGGAALQKLGIDILAAHLFVFYYAVLADVTPPVAVTAFAGAQIAGADPMKTGWQGCRFAIGGFLAPFLFVYQPGHRRHQCALGRGGGAHVPTPELAPARSPRRRIPGRHQLQPDDLGGHQRRPPRLCRVGRPTGQAGHGARGPNPRREPGAGLQLKTRRPRASPAGREGRPGVYSEHEGAEIRGDRLRHRGRELHQDGGPASATARLGRGP
jgi:TRAP transporter 4TM/12TM fusion protein